MLMKVMENFVSHALAGGLDGQDFRLLDIVTVYALRNVYKGPWHKVCMFYAHMVRQVQM
jgi:hypothetical protein